MLSCTGLVRLHARSCAGSRAGRLACTARCCSLLSNVALRLRSDAWFYTSAAERIAQGDIRPDGPFYAGMQLWYFWGYHVYLLVPRSVCRLSLFDIKASVNVLVFALYLLGVYSLSRRSSFTPLSVSRSWSAPAPPSPVWRSRGGYIRVTANPRAVSPVCSCWPSLPPPSCRTLRHRLGRRAGKCTPLRRQRGVSLDAARGGVTAALSRRRSSHATSSANIRRDVHIPFYRRRCGPGDLHPVAPGKLIHVCVRRLPSHDRTGRRDGTRSFPTHAGPRWSAVHSARRIRPVRRRDGISRYRGMHPRPGR